MLLLTDFVVCLGGRFVILVGLWYLVAFRVVFVVYRFASLFCYRFVSLPGRVWLVDCCMVRRFDLCVGVGRFVAVVLGVYLIWV